MIRLLALLALLATGLPAAAQELVAALSINRVQITANFDGSEVIVFGAVKHTGPIEDEGKLDVIVTLTGPSLPVTVRRKEKVAGIWVNRDAVDVDLAPVYYAISTTGPFDAILSDVDDLRYKISIDRAIRAVGVAQDVADVESFTDALIRIRTADGHYLLREGTTSLADDTLFRTDFDLPAALIEGDYTAHIYLVRDRQVIATHEQVIDVRKVGLGRWIFNLAHQQPLVYGLLSLAIAIAAGWSASAIFRIFRF